MILTKAKKKKLPLQNRKKHSKLFRRNNSETFQEGEVLSFSLRSEFSQSFYSSPINWGQRPDMSYTVALEESYH